MLFRSRLQVLSPHRPRYQRHQVSQRQPQLAFQHRPLCRPHQVCRHQVLLRHRHQYRHHQVCRLVCQLLFRQGNRKMLLQTKYKLFACLIWFFFWYSF